MTVCDAYKRSARLARISDERTGTTALYHDAIRAHTNSQAIATERGTFLGVSRCPFTSLPLTNVPGPPAVHANRNCSVDIFNLPEGTTMSHVLDAVACHRPVGHIYKCDLLQAVGNGGRALRAARVRFKAPESAARLFQIGNQPSGLGLYVRGAKVGVRFARVSTSAYSAEGTRVVVFRGPKHVVHADNLRGVWGGEFLGDQVQKVIQGAAGADGIREVEWRFNEFAWGAQVAKCLFEDRYGRRGDCSARYGVDPCA